MFVETISTVESTNAERLRQFDIGSGHAEALARINEILQPHVVDLSTLYLDSFTYAANIRLDAETRQKEVARLAEFGGSKYAPPINDAWFARIEKTGELLFRMRAPLRANLSALGRSHRASIEYISHHADSAEDAEYLVDQFLRITALETEVMVTTIQRLEHERFQARFEENARMFHDSIAQFISDSHDRSAQALARTNQVVEATNDLVALSNDVAAASTQSSAAMRNAAEMAGHLEGTIKAIEGNLANALNDFGALTATTVEAKDSAASLAENTHSIERIVKMIQSIADRTKILSLNALIEAASAGDAGAGFSVVANEMKGLATQTEDATLEIAAQLSGISRISKDSISSYSVMESKFRELEHTAEQLKDSLRTQSEAVVSIAACIDETAQSADSSSAALVQIGRQTANVSQGIDELSGSIETLDDRLTQLDRSAKTFGDGLAN